MAGEGLRSSALPRRGRADPGRHRRRPGSGASRAPRRPAGRRQRPRARRRPHAPARGGGRRRRRSAGAARPHRPSRPRLLGRLPLRDRAGSPLPRHRDDHGGRRRLRGGSHVRGVPALRHRRVGHPDRPLPQHRSHRHGVAGRRGAGGAPAHRPGGRVADDRRAPRPDPRDQGPAVAGPGGVERHGGAPDRPGSRGGRGSPDHGPRRRHADLAGRDPGRAAARGRGHPLLPRARGRDPRRPWRP